MPLDGRRALPRFEFPRPDHHTVIVGQNGSGKSQCGFWLLSKANIDQMPWVIFDTKQEPMFKRLRRNGAIRSKLRPSSLVPRSAGLYLMQPDEEDDDAVDDFLFRAYKKGRIGFYFDEGYAVPDGNSSALHKILTRGRSRRTPTITCVQRPVLVDHFFFTEAKHIVVFDLIDREDRRTVARYAPIDIDVQLARFHSFWYDNSRRILFEMPPVPHADVIAGQIKARAPEHWWWGAWSGHS